MTNNASSSSTPVLPVPRLPESIPSFAQKHLKYLKAIGSGALPVFPLENIVHNFNQSQNKKYLRQLLMVRDKTVQLVRVRLS